LKRYQGLPFDFSTVDRYLSKAEEYAVLNRSTRDHLLFVKIWRLCAGLLEQPEKAGQSIAEILALLEKTTPFFQSLAYGRMANALWLILFAVERDFIQRGIQPPLNNFLGKFVL